jgi:hypothetical protein
MATVTNFVIVPLSFLSGTFIQLIDCQAFFKQ